MGKPIANPYLVDNWYILSLGEKPVGYYHETITRSGKEVNSAIHMLMRISRLGSEAVLDSRQVFKEDLQGNLQSVRSELLFSKAPSITTAYIRQGVIHVVNEAGGKASSADVFYTGALSGNEGIRLLTLKTLSRVGDSLAYQVFIPDFGKVFKGVRKYTGMEQVELNGKITNVMKVKDTFEGLPTVRESWLDPEGRLLKSSEPNPFGQMTLVRSSETAARTIAAMKTELSEDQYAAAVTRSNVRLPQPRALESVTVKITQNVPGAGLPDFSGSYQQVIRKSKDEVVLKIRTPAPGEMKEPLTTLQREEYLGSSFFINKDDTMAVQLTRQITGSETDYWRKVILIRDWVNTNMTFNAGITMAPSSEVLRNLEGTCVSFATITTTLCRAAGIPSRYLMGLIYVDGIWGGHAWAEVYIQNSWIPVDAAMPGPGGVADASRIFFARTSVKNGLGETMVAGSQVYANVTMEVLSYTLAGREFQAIGDLYHVDAEGYHNAGLGISMKTLAGFTFGSLDKVYPESILFSMDNDQAGQSVKLYQEFVTPRRSLEAILQQYAGETGPAEETICRGNRALKVASDERAVLAVASGNDVYVLVTSGASAGETLQKAIANFIFGKF